MEPWSITKVGLDGNSAATLAAIAAIADIRGADVSQLIMDRPRSMFASCPQEVSTLRLRIATKLDRYRQTARMMLDPWMVEAALARLRKSD